MNIIWTSILILGLGLLAIDNVDIAMSSILSGGSNAVALVIKLWGIYAVWLGLLKIVEETELDKKIAKLLNPLIKFLIGKTDDYTSGQLAINITSNIFGMGNASTPSGINAIKGLDKGSKYATTSMIMIIILNATNMQLIPTTVIGLRVIAGSTSASDIILPTLIASLSSSVVGIFLVKIISKFVKDKKNE